MRFVLFCHSVKSDWNNGHAHFLRGVVHDLQRRGHVVDVYEPTDAWSPRNLKQLAGHDGILQYQDAYPDVRSWPYFPSTIDLDAMLADADVVIVHEWTPSSVINAVAEHRRERGGYRAYFHDTHHSVVTFPLRFKGLDLTGYDGVLSFGDAVRDRFLDRGWCEQAWTWHEAADPHVFRPRPDVPKDGDVVWIGNWGDEERTQALREYLLTPAKELGLTGRVHGVRYPPQGRRAVEEAGLEYGGWVPNTHVPDVFARHRVAVHIPRGPYRHRLPGVPTIRMFEALACGIPLVTSPWRDVEGLFTEGRDYLMARDGDEMRDLLRALMEDEGRRRALAGHGRRTILARHTCRHRVDELLAIDERVRGVRRGGDAAPPVAPPAPEATVRYATRGPTSDRPAEGMRVAFFGSSLVSSLWNGAATYYQGLLKAMSDEGWRVTFYEPDVRGRQQHRDIPDPDWARVVVYPAGSPDEVRRVLGKASGADLVVKASGVGVFDDLLEREVLKLRSPDTRVVFWDVDAPATLDRMKQDPDDAFRALVPQYDGVFTYGGGPPVVEAYEAFGAKRCVPIYNAVDPDTHHPAPPDPRFEADLAFLGNRLPDREARVERFLLGPAASRRDLTFLLGGSGWEDKTLPPNVLSLGHIGTRDHNAFNSTPRAVLNINRDSMAEYGYSPATRVFEAAGAAACIITDAFRGVEEFLTPDKEILVARDGDEVVRHLDELTPERAEEIGRRAWERVLREHTYRHRVKTLLAALDDMDRERVEVKA